MKASNIIFNTLLNVLEEKAYISEMDGTQYLPITNEDVRLIANQITTDLKDQLIDCFEEVE